MASPDLRCEYFDGVTVIHVAGELDLNSVPALLTVARQEVGTDGCTAMILNLKGLEFLDSTGMGCFVQLHNYASQLNKTMELQDVPPGPQRILTIAGLAPLLGIAPG